MENLTIAQVFKTARAMQGMTQIEFAEFLGLGKRLIKETEQGRRNVSFGTLHILLTKCNINLTQTPNGYNIVSRE